MISGSTYNYVPNSGLDDQHQVHDQSGFSLQFPMQWVDSIAWDSAMLAVGRLQEYEVIGRHLPTETDPAPKLYRLQIFAPNSVVAKSRYWYFMKQLRKVKKSTGEIVSVKVISEKRPTKVKNFGIWIRYDSRSGTHNMYKEYRDLSRTSAVESLYQDMAARHRARFRSIHILKVVELEKSEDVKRQYIKQLLTPGLKFPLPHRVIKSKQLFSPNRPSTFY
ncbi:ribosomal L18ae/LX protein domain-containing protein [Lipomyces doorenjongii]